MPKKGFITTSSKASNDLYNKAVELGQKWSVPFVERKKQSLAKLLANNEEPAYVMTSSRIEVYLKHEDQPFFFHPNAAMFRAKRWLKNKDDAFVSVCNIKDGDTVVDATLGLASDAQLASLASGRKGKVIGLEASETIADLVEEGLYSYVSSNSKLNEAMRRIEVVSTMAEDWLAKQPGSSVDIIYFDPMFQKKVDSDGLSGLKQYSHYGDFSEKVFDEAKRVAKKRVVLKDHFQSARFEKYGFHVQVRRSSVFHYGVIELEKRE